ncbi:MlaD family protein [Aquimarina intermedia]|uniref:Phospholipid/cholesterol/gamma-HCH transport system substrate-binding protein n=1 Tax=Aquimarina intermedia TaxID=350814 RepID=A0A5S5C4E7_9FLAO|nr:MlaD family protein [Aquimarina intermedia]TYP74291.1 phospholipid/cholesterol/gamma-HCH transport system substrate-binding protein [Aquimarina intermedia]
MSGIKNSSSQNFRLGVFVVLGTLILISALYFIGKRQNLFSNTITLYAEFKNLNGLQLGNNVRHAGINVGVVNKILMINDSRIVVGMSIQEDLSQHIKQNAIATIGSDGLVGNMLINIIPQSGDGTIVKSGDTIRTYSRIGADDMLTTLNVTNENAALLTADLLKLTTKILNGKGTLGMLINDSLVAKDLKKTMNNLKLASAQASQVLRETNAAFKTIQSNNSVINTIAFDTVSGTQIKNLLANLDESSMKIKQMSTDLTNYFEQLKDADGVLNYLTNDASVVRSIDSTLFYIKEGTYKFNQSMEALQHNFLLRGYFKKQERLKEKKE